jgi:hypothetical protein
VTMLPANSIGWGLASVMRSDCIGYMCMILSSKCVACHNIIDISSKPAVATALLLACWCWTQDSCARPDIVGQC